MNQPLFALIDCNSFFVSCERVFRPDLANKPVVVLSSNDDCVIARSNEAKAAGIPMGAPVFKYRQALKAGKVVQFSANFELYGDISRRITEILTSITPKLEIYSIDEAFLDISNLPIANYEAWAKSIQDTILKWVGIPVRIGIAPTKTLAKLASDLSKQRSDRPGILSFVSRTGMSPDKTTLEKIRIEEVWGIGRHMGPRLRSRGLATANDLARLSPAQGRACFGSVLGERLVRELNGQACLSLEPVGKEQKSISATRTFGQDSPETHVVEAALASFTARAAGRLRANGLIAGTVSIFLTTNRHKPGYKKYYKRLKLSEPTMDNGVLMGNAFTLFASIYESQVQYHRAGITLGDLRPSRSFQIDLLDGSQLKHFVRSQARMTALDSVNARHGAGTLRYAAEQLTDAWQPRKQLSSPRYTTHWNELPRVKISTKDY